MTINSPIEMARDFVESAVQALMRPGMGCVDLPDIPHPQARRLAELWTVKAVGQIDHEQAAEIRTLEANLA